MTSIEYSGLTNEEALAVLDALREVGTHGIESAMIQKDVHGHVKLTLQGDAEAEEMELLDGRLSALSEKKV